MTDKVQKIREEVERIINRRLNLINGDYFDLNKETDGFTNEIIDIIDSLQEVPVSKDLEEEIEEYWKNAPTGTVYFPMWEHFQIIAHHFAEWGKKQAEIEIQAQSMALAHGCPKEPVSEDLELSWEDIPKIFQISEELKTSWWFRDNKQTKKIGTQVFWEEVLKRFRERKDE